MPNSKVLTLSVQLIPDKQLSIAPGQLSIFHRSLFQNYAPKCPLPDPLIAKYGPPVLTASIEI